MPKLPQDPVMLFCSLAGIVIAFSLRVIGILPNVVESMIGDLLGPSLGEYIEAGLEGGLLACGGYAAGFTVGTIYRHFFPWQ